MPLFAYFAVVGSVLVGLLYVAEARLGPAASLSITTNFHGLPAPWKAATSVPVLTVRDGVEPAMPAITVAQAAMAAEARAPAVTKTAVEKKARPARKVARHNGKRNVYAHSTRNLYAHSTMPPRGMMAPRQNTIVW